MLTSFRAGTPCDIVPAVPTGAGVSIPDAQSLGAP
ncbi:hypothetical protein BX257_0472 [Streptomyces sp. 3212.3]|nr:hypothetical protein BX257_0472 [Streptomyces sp. 3212.3]